MREKLTLDNSSVHCDAQARPIWKKKRNTRKELFSNHEIRNIKVIIVLCCKRTSNNIVGKVYFLMFCYNSQEKLFKARVLPTISLIVRRLFKRKNSETCDYYQLNLDCGNSLNFELHKESQPMISISGQCFSTDTLVDNPQLTDKRRYF